MTAHDYPRPTPALKLHSKPRDAKTGTTTRIVGGENKDSISEITTEANESKNDQTEISPETPSSTNTSNEFSQLELLAAEIQQALKEPVPDDTIQLCGPAPLQIISSLPDEVRTLAYDKLSTWPFHAVPTCWRRLYEDTSLLKTVQLIHSATTSDEISTPTESNNKRRKLNPPNTVIDQIIVELDKGLTISGAPGRKDVFEFAFTFLEDLINDPADESVPKLFSFECETELSSKYPIPRAEDNLSFDLFQAHLTKHTTPLIIPGTFTHWPALERWQDPTYLLAHTLGGRRLVPVEIGKSYTDSDWSQRVMPMREFMQTYLLPSNPSEIGYLAQHDLFAQIPALRNDIAIPDYCFTEPPAADSAVRKTAGLKDVAKLEEPMLNAWLGPRGTKTPLHTDPYHNVLCQVVGYKYVRLYPPDESSALYPRGLDEKGISMANTSLVDVELFRSPWKDRGSKNDQEGDDRAQAAARMNAEFPLFGKAKYQEAMIGPGECIYIPLGWWHYIESASTSFSVSFWWN